MKYEVIKRLWTDDRVWAYGFAFWTQTKCFLIFCVPVAFVELTMGMKYSSTCSGTFGKSLLLQKQIWRSGRQRHSRKRQSMNFCTSYLVHSGYWGKNKVHCILLLLQHATEFINWWIFTCMCRKTLDQRDVVTKMDRIESNKNRPSRLYFLLSIVVNIIHLFSF